VFAGRVVADRHGCRQVLVLGVGEVDFLARKTNHLIIYQ
jgi:hypothetical protein